MLQDMGISPDDAEQLYNAPILDFIDWILNGSIQEEKKSLCIEDKVQSNDDICKIQLTREESI